jgi:hypothetical protein
MERGVFRGQFLLILALSIKHYQRGAWAGQGVRQTARHTPAEDPCVAAASASRETNVGDGRNARRGPRGAMGSCGDRPRSGVPCL